MMRDGKEGAQMCAERNKALARRIVDEMWNTQNLNVVDEVYAPHMGHEGTKGFVASVLAAIPDLRITIQDQVAEGDRVATRYVMEGTHQGELMGIGPTGKRFSVMGIEVHRFEDGKVVELWNLVDWLEALQQLGVIPRA
jgi:steroid delta-isomerase-like uncharacterized protein